MSSQVVVFPDPNALADGAADRFVVAATDAIDHRGRFVVALAGGETPRGTYQRLAAEPWRSRVPWSQVVMLWGDERCVPPDSVESNFRMAREAMLDHVPVLPANIHRIRGEEVPATAAAEYEQTLRALLATPDAGSGIDLVLLGLGADGHTASIFPGSAAAGERVRWVVAEDVTAVSMWRISLTTVVINAAAEVLFLVSGGTKADILRRVLQRAPDGSEFPAQRIAPSSGRVVWLADAAAAAGLGKVTS
ncbi:MAG: 6-phosphogluconolactonase [Gemmatimonadales bacterium]